MRGDITMTHDRRDRETVQDLTFVLAQDRIGDLRASAAHPTSGDASTATAPGSGTLVTRARDTLGRRLIALGGSVVADENLRRRALQL
jgi:hypothetical protein